MGKGKELPEEEAARVAAIKAELADLMNRGLSPNEVNAIARSKARGCFWCFEKRERRRMKLETGEGSLVYTPGDGAAEATVAITSPSFTPKETVVLGLASIGITDWDELAIRFKSPPAAEGEEAGEMIVLIDQEGAFSVSPSEGL